MYLVKGCLIFSLDSLYLIIIAGNNMGTMQSRNMGAPTVSTDLLLIIYFYFFNCPRK